MVSQNLDDLLSLLMAVIVADKRTFAEEIQVFVTEGVKLQTTLNMKPVMSEAKVLMWYELNKAAVKKNVLGPYLKTWLYDRLNRLAHIDNKPAILEAMRQVALADGEIHVSERALMVLAARQWVLYPLGDA